jgi:cytochrome c-type biogenesis protein CcsB
MTQLEVVFFWVALVGYGLAGILNLAGLLIFKKENFLTYSERIGLIAFLSHLVALVWRTIITSHFPVKGGYENALAGVAVVMLFYFWLRRAFEALSLVGSGVFFISLVVMGSSLTNVPPLGPLTPAYKSIWLWIHVAFAWLAYAAFTIAAALAVLYLVKEKKPAGKGYLVRLPSLEKIDDLWFRYVTFGFVTDAVMIASGAVWAHYLWGSYWSWDPVETWNLITWLIFGLFLHLRLTLGWKGKRLAWLTILGLITINIGFWGVQLIPQTYHLFRNI